MSSKRKGFSGSFSSKFPIINWKKLKPADLTQLIILKKKMYQEKIEKTIVKNVIFFYNFKMQIRNTRIAPLSEHGK